MDSLVNILINLNNSSHNVWKSVIEGADCQISAAFFKNFIVEINFDQMIIKLSSPVNFTYKGIGQEITMWYGVQEIQDCCQPELHR